MKQLVQLQEHLQAFQDAGFNVVVLTYDSPMVQQKFIDTWNIQYPMLSDSDAATVKALQILNADYQPGDQGYGIPYPGIFVIGNDQRIAGKIFVDGYQIRVKTLNVLKYAASVLPE